MQILSKGTYQMASNKVNRRVFGYVGNQMICSNIRVLLIVQEKEGWWFKNTLWQPKSTVFERQQCLYRSRHINCFPPWSPRWCYRACCIIVDRVERIKSPRDWKNQWPPYLRKHTHQWQPNRLTYIIAMTFLTSHHLTKNIANLISTARSPCIGAHARSPQGIMT